MPNPPASGQPPHEHPGSESDAIRASAAHYPGNARHLEVKI